MKVDVQHLAKLAQMQVTPEEGKTLEKGFEQTLKVIDQLNELDTSKVKPTSQVTGLTNVLREDKVIQKDLDLLSNTKHKKDNFFTAPKTI